MCKVVTFTADGKYEFNCNQGELLSSVLKENHLFISQPCAGKGICGKCKVKADGILSVPSQKEKAFLHDQIAKGYRLACMTKIIGDVSVDLRENANEIAILTTGETAQGFLWDKNNIGVAVDIGTTTISAHMFDEKKMIGDCALPNAQRMFGSEVISRIEASLKGQGDELRTAILEEVDKIVLELSKKSSMLQSSINEIVFTGNTAMLYFLAGKNPQSISTAPFEADCLFNYNISSEKLGLKSCAEATAYFPPCISAFVGADVVCAILSSGMINRTETALLVDIGTNGEMALWHGGKLSCCSTAAGPTFEGSGISMGVQSVAGAIDSIVIDEKNNFIVHTINHAQPVGICGSGVLDAVAVGLEVGAIDETGALNLESSKVVKINDEYAIKICEGIYFTQKDVRMVQLAKSAICSGIKTMLKEAQIFEEEVERFYIAGGFGNFINAKNAAAIGLFPPKLKEKAIVLGNAAQSGADAILKSKEAIRQSEKIAQMADTINLSSSKMFSAYFYEEISFNEC